MHKTLTLFSCGGLGTNLAVPYIQNNNKKEQGFTDFHTVFIDTSLSNIKHKQVPDEYVYHVEGLDGAGKKRDVNYRAVSPKIKDMLNKHKPTDINIVLHSTSGGSGSLVAPLIVAELLSRGHAVIVMAVGSTTSKIEIDNTIKTLKSYDNISRKQGRPICVLYRENGKDRTTAQVDIDINSAIFLTSIVFSGDNEELDSADLNNFIDYNKVTSFEPQLVGLDYCFNKVVVANDQNVISRISLTAGEREVEHDQPIEYQSTGFVSNKAMEVIEGKLPLHLVTVNNYFTRIIADLEEKLKIIDQNRAAINIGRVSDDVGDATDEGLVF